MCLRYPTPVPGSVQGMKKGHVVLAALATVVGFGTAFGVEAASYRDIGTVAEGVYLLEGDGAFKVQALEPVTAVIYNQEGALLLAKALGSGEARTFVVGEGAVAAILGGDAKVQARNDGRMMRLDTVVNVVELAENSGAMDERFSVRLPPFLVGLSGRVQGEAQGLLVEVSSSKGLVYRYADGGSEVNLAALTAEVMDARIAADRLDGRIVLEVHQPDFGQMEWAFASEEAWTDAQARPAPPAHEGKERRHAEAKQHRERAMAHAESDGRERAWEPSLEDLTGVPIQLRFDSPGVVGLDLKEGYGVDLSLYDASGAQVQYLQRGTRLDSERAWCGSFLDCFGPTGRGGSYEEVMPEVVEWTLDPGEYLLYVRMGGADGTFAFQGLSEHVEVEPVTIEGSLSEAETLELDAAVLDFWVWDSGASVDRSIAAMLNGGTFYEEHRTASLFGQALERSVMYDPSLLGSGTLEIAVGGLGLPMDDGMYGVIVAPSPHATEDEN